MGAISEAECYLRCYGTRGTEVRVLAHPGYDSDPRREPSEAGERLRRLLELRIDAREPEAA